WRRGFVAPRPIHQIRPVVPASLLADHAGMIAVEIKVRVDQAGHVTTAELLGTNAPEMLQELVLDAARGWQFAPAQLNGRAVASQSVLRFRFEP
ncbi:MAG: energy transducer TonB, partial [Acidobacteria bacterium]|nr:energy transducer TonB [Acidobacteriota bacterium]